ncbi:MAG: hypothetical protein HYR85_06770 [Planctomycetes bacterium]|nr:hypothetical protein [Planctomycetota bacterium]MBI3846454.1 hypothetical protein [Planctomycetota bacterium]
MDRADHDAAVERAYRDYVDGLDRALAPLRVVGRLGFLPQGAENCVDLFEVIDCVNHFLDDAEALRHQLDTTLEVGPQEKPKPPGGHDDRRPSSNGNHEPKTHEPKSDSRTEKPKGENKAKPE